MTEAQKRAEAEGKAKQKLERAFPMLRTLGFPVVYDVTHSLQLPGGGDGVTAGQAQFIEPLASAGSAGALASA